MSLNCEIVPKKNFTIFERQSISDEVRCSFGNEIEAAVQIVVIRRTWNMTTLFLYQKVVATHHPIFKYFWLKIIARQAAMEYV